MMNLLKKRNLPSRRSSFPSLFHDDFFHDFFGTTPLESLDNFTPALNIKENEKEYVFEAELPGVDKKNIDISIKDNNLCLKGEKKTFDEEKKEDYHRVERSYGSFYRTIPLATDADVEKVSADYRDGLLIVSVGKITEPKDNHRKIDIR
jgi:HSP20 family protein